MAPREADGDQLDVFAWNPHVSRTARELRDVLDDQLTPRRPDVIVLNEVWRHHAALLHWAQVNDYAHRQEEPGTRSKDPVPEDGSTAVLVTRRRRDLMLTGRRVVVMRKRWKVFSANRWHEPRRYEHVRLRMTGWRVKVRASHWPTNGPTGGNRVAFVESMVRAAAMFAATRPGTVVADVGDHNTSVRTLRRWGKRLGLSVAGHGPDSAIVRGASVEVDVLGKHGSDHHAMRYLLTRNRRSTR